VDCTFHKNSFENSYEKPQLKRGKSAEISTDPFPFQVATDAEIVFELPAQEIVSISRNSCFSISFALLKKSSSVSYWLITLCRIGSKIFMESQTCLMRGNESFTKPQFFSNIIRAFAKLFRYRVINC